MARSSVSLGRVISRAAIAARASPPSLFKQSLTIRSGLNNDLSQWDKSRVWKQLSGFLPPGKHLTGDTGYKIWGHMLAPFPEAEALQDSRKRLYNYLHPKTRIVVECAFGRLKDRFRILLGKLKQKSADHVCKVVIGFVVLHNLFLLAAVTWNAEERKFMVRLTGYNTKHNHRVDRVVCENHPSVRRVEDPMTLAFADVMQSSGSKQKRITQFLRDKTGQNVTLQDVYSMVARLREERRGSDTVEQRLESLLRGFCGRRGNPASLFVDDATLAQTITVRTRHMQRWFKAFPGVMVVDTTHNTNGSRHLSTHACTNDIDSARERDKLRVISGGGSFNAANELVVMALHVANNHWYGIVFDFRAGSRGITVFDPLQHQNSKYYGMCDTLLKNLFGEMCDLMRIKKESKTRQPDVASCGVMVLTFFECFIQGMVIPSKPSPTLLRFLRLRYLLKCLH
ncbi:hypothetical protein PI124_g19746 [Phytophthora idaei]|nr:hypothetical protein PI124_g19746 [Phytophthora idaei]